MITSPVAIATLNALPYHSFYSIALVYIHRWVEPQLLSSSTRPFNWSTVPVCNWFIEQCLPKKCYSRQWQAPAWLTRVQASCGWALTLQTRTSSQFHTQIHLPATPPWGALVAAQVICLVFLCFILFRLVSWRRCVHEWLALFVPCTFPFEVLFSVHFQRCQLTLEAEPRLFLTVTLACVCACVRLCVLLTL